MGACGTFSNCVKLQDLEQVTDDIQTGKLYHTFSGHFEEVTGLQLAGRVAVSVSIDATIRQWTLRPEHLKKAREEAEAEQQGKVPVEEAVSSSVLTEEEERELAELMDEDD